MFVKTKPYHGCSENICPNVWRCLLWSFLSKVTRVIRSHKRPMAEATWPSACLAVVFSACKKELAKNVCRPTTQYVAGHKEFVRGMGPEYGRVY